MKKIDAITKGRKFVEKLFGVKKHCINRALDDALDNIEKQRIDAENGYENYLAKLADDNVDYKSVINKMIDYKQIILNSDETCKTIEQIREDLESEVDDLEIDDSE